MVQCIRCWLSTLEDQSSDPQSPCKCRVGTVTLLRFERQKGDFPEQTGEISLQAALALVESPRLWIKGLGGIRRLWTSALGLHMHQHVHMCPYTAEHTHSRRLTHHAPTHTHSFLYNIPCYTPSAHIHHSHTLTHSYPHTHSYTTHTTYTHTTSLYLPRPHTHTQHTHTYITHSHTPHTTNTNIHTHHTHTHSTHPTLTHLSLVDTDIHTNTQRKS